MNKIALALLLLGALNTANAIRVLAVLEILPKSNVEEQITIDEMRHLTDELRKQATMVLPTDGYAVLTRDNIIALIPADEKEAECLAESCAVDIGRAIGAEYVTQGSIGKFGKKLSISVELYETMGGKLLGSIVMESDDIEGLLTVIRQEANSLFSKIIPKQSATPLPPPPQPVTPTLPPQPPTQIQPQPQVSVTQLSEPNPIPQSQNPIPQTQTQKSRIPMWVGIALDVIGAGLVAYGFVKNVEIGNLQKDYDAYDENSRLTDIKATRNDMIDAKNLRNIMYISGGVALVSGIGIHIWF